MSEHIGVEEKMDCLNILLFTNEHDIENSISSKISKFFESNKIEINNETDNEKYDYKISRKLFKYNEHTFRLIQISQFEQPENEMKTGYYEQSLLKLYKNMHHFHAIFYELNNSYSSLLTIMKVFNDTILKNIYYFISEHHQDASGTLLYKHVGNDQIFYQKEDYEINFEKVFQGIITKEYCMKAENLLLPMLDVIQVINENLEQQFESKCIPEISLKLLPFEGPGKICTTNDCCTEKMFLGKPIKTYKMRCHVPCYLRFKYPELKGCTRANNRRCMTCGCHERNHIIVNYMTTRCASPITVTSEEHFTQIRKNWIKIRETLIVGLVKVHKFLEQNNSLPKFNIQSYFNEKPYLFDIFYNSMKEEIEITENNLEDLIDEMFKLNKFGEVLKNLYTANRNRAHDEINIPSLKNIEPKETSMKKCNEPCEKRNSESREFEVYEVFDKTRRGNVLIINNIDYVKGYRDGADIDQQALESMFEDMDGWGCKTIMNVSNEFSMEEELKIYKKQLDDNFSILIIIVMSHGDLDGVKFTKSSTSYDYNDFITKFNNKNCERLKGIPKVFIFQFCRGSKGLEENKISNEHANQPDNNKNVVTDSWNFDNVIESDSSQFNPDDKTNQKELENNKKLKDTENIGLEKGIKTETDDILNSCISDTLIWYCTLPNFKSVRDPKKGSYFIQVICTVLREYSSQHHVENLFKIISKTLSETDINEETDKGKNFVGRQIPVSENIGFIKHLFLHPGKH